jgi:hypothetical protein
MSDFDSSTYHEWTSCEVHGHLFVKDEETGTRSCQDCGEKEVE